MRAMKKRKKKKTIVHHKFQVCEKANHFSGVKILPNQNSLLQNANHPVLLIHSVMWICFYVNFESHNIFFHVILKAKPSLAWKYICLLPGTVYKASKFCKNRGQKEGIELFWSKIWSSIWVFSHPKASFSAILKISYGFMSCIL